MLRPFALVPLGLLLSSCGRREGIGRSVVDDSHPGGLSEIRFSNPRAALHVLEGFYLEKKDVNWRWTQKNFAFAVGVPRRGQDATLELRFTIPKPVLDRLHSMALAATAGSTALAPETYSTAGDHLYSRPVPGSALSADLVRIEFTLDKTVPAAEMDGRELGVIVSSVALR